MAQNSFQVFLLSIEKNNKSIYAAKEFVQTRQLEARTDITPENPEFEFGHFSGNTSEIGTKQVIGLTQNLKFPTTYIYKNRLANQSGRQFGLDYMLVKQEILLQAAEVWCNAIHLNKKKTILKTRSEQAAKLLEFYLKKQKNGDATQLEVNKSHLFLINVQNQLRLIESQQVQNNQLLAQLNGGVLLEVSDTAFPSNTINTWNEFELALDSLHPEIQKLALEELMVNTQLKLSRSQWMPNLMLGYESEEVLSEKFQGIKAGISIPLWQEKNKIKKAKAELVYASAKKESVQLNLLTDYHNRYIQAKALQTNTLELKKSLATMNNQYLLSRSLELGQISAIEYFMELDYFYGIIDQLYELELQYQLSWMRLNQFKF
jgi:outer membrane protein TolC